MTKNLKVASVTDIMSGDGRNVIINFIPDTEITVDGEMSDIEFVSEVAVIDNNAVICAGSRQSVILQNVTVPWMTTAGIKLKCKIDGVLYSRDIALMGSATTPTEPDPIDNVLTIRAGDVVEFEEVEE